MFAAFSMVCANESDSTKVEFPFSVKVTVNFSSELEDKSSEKYKNYSEEFRRKLLDTFGSTPGLRTIEIVGFRNGSVIADYIIGLYAAEKNTLIQSLTFINTTVNANLHKLTISIDSQSVSINMIEMSSQLVKVQTKRKYFIRDDKQKL
ncbi:hypothetical protein CHS0354_010458 [Potamilus streckersoni]|uniref:SEA domain-containing protein n=1 Tax=Potamilus streckersoni TaxID=2493646 RepID=A0AAE0VW56_9BIVA|nr:hypothetical protein CHS0354_010458 [Potamilus streckersoni]